VQNTITSPKKQQQQEKTEQVTKKQKTQLFSSCFDLLLLNAVKKFKQTTRKQKLKYFSKHKRKQN